VAIASWPGDLEPGNGVLIAAGSLGAGKSALLGQIVAPATVHCAVSSAGRRRRREALGGTPYSAAAGAAHRAGWTGVLGSTNP
jgi:hypothetical protein